MSTRHRLLAAVVLATALTAVHQPPTSAATGREPLTAMGLVSALAAEGMAVPNPIDTTSQECPAAGCGQAVVTDTMRVKSFPVIQQARWYAASQRLPRFGNIVVEFAPPLSTAQCDGYLEAIGGLLP